ncbi:MAG: transcription elongation factor GreA [Chloroflexi bacterium]|nr:transcription elongation factor GreA [Chloroflexota bacterium]
MNDLKPTLLTEEGLQRLTEELEYLTTVKREEIAERLHAAFEDGQDDDFVENAGLEAARNDQAFLEGRIQELEDILKNYEIIQEPNGADSVRIGSWVVICEEGYDEEERYHLVGPAEANPDESRISNESPLGRALLGAKVGDVVQVNSPNGILEFRILKIE